MSQISHIWAQSRDAVVTKPGPLRLEMAISSVFLIRPFRASDLYIRHIPRP